MSPKVGRQRPRRRNRYRNPGSQQGVSAAAPVRATAQSSRTATSPAIAVQRAAPRPASGAAPVRNYDYVVHDLKRIAITGSIMVALIVAFYFILG